MTEKNVELARRGYAFLNDAYRQRDVSLLFSLAEEMWHPDIVLTFQGQTFLETGEWRGHEGVLQFTEDQTDAFEQMWIEPKEFIDADERLVVAVRFGGRARHTGLPVDFAAFHVWTMKDGKAARFDIYETRAEALAAAGLPEHGEKERMVRESMLAHNRRDIDGVLATAHPQVEVEFIGGFAGPMGEGTFIGPEGLRRFLTDWFATFATVEARPERFLEAGERLLALVRLKATLEGSPFPVEVLTGQVWSFKDGKISRWDAYWEPAEAFAAVGLSPE